LKHVGSVAYRLALPPGSSNHLVCHVSQLKPHLGSRDTAFTGLPAVDSLGALRPESIVVLDRRMTKAGSRAVTELLIPWHGHSSDDATWERLYQFQRDFSHLVDKVF
jgi:hypothetical protein